MKSDKKTTMEDYFDTIIGGCPGGACIANGVGRVIKFNKRFASLISSKMSEGDSVEQLLATRKMNKNKTDKNKMKVRSRLIKGGKGENFNLVHVAGGEGRSEAKKRLEAEKQKTKAFMNSTNESTFLIDSDCTVIDVNEVGARRLNSTPEEMIGRNFSEFIPDEVWQQRYPKIASVFAGDGPIRFEDTRGGYDFINSITPLLDDELDVFMVLYSASDITDKKRAEKLLEYNANHDVLTGLSNRFSFLRHLECAINENRENPANGFAVLYMDLDRFKFVNDTYGHIVGDKFLSEIAHRLSCNLRSERKVARLGGDEFIVLLQGEDIYSEVLQALKNVYASFQRPYSIENRDMHFSVSIGIVIGDARYSIPEQILRDADIAMYKAKAKGSGKYEFFCSQMHDEVKQRLELESELTSAIEREELVLHYHPIFDIPSGKVSSFEVLLRWNHPEKGLLPPSAFLPIAEESGAITKITRYVISKALRQVKLWRWNDEISDDVHVNVNLSGVDFQSEDLHLYVENLLRALSLPGETIHFEITEGVLMENTGAAAKMIGRLRALGAKVYLDDFGTGYSSLAYLTNFPIDGLKIDRSFVQNMVTQKNGEKIVRSIIRLAGDLELDSIAEGVETLEQLQHLHFLNCRGAQGFYFSKPVPESELPGVLAALKEKLTA